MNKEEKNSNKCPFCGRPTHKESKYCIFHAGAEEKTEAEFKKALKEYIQEIQKKDKYYDFKQFVFVGDIEFKKSLGINTFKNANFQGATFEGNANFMGTTFTESTLGKSAQFSETIFKGDTHFIGVTFKCYTDFIGVTFIKGAIFALANFKEDAFFQMTTFGEVANFQHVTFVGDATFWQTTFGEVANFTKTTFGGIANFTKTTFGGFTELSEATFKGKTYFVGVTFKGNTDFTKTTFNGDANFTGTTFNGDACFMGAAFESFTYFASATFEHDANFGEAIFKISTEFKVTTFKGDACFEDTTFMGYSTYFTNVIFERVANFFVVKFKGNAIFKGATFEHHANFEEATFEGDVDFRLKYFVKILNFSKIKTFSGKKLFIRLNNEGGKVFFERAYLENTYLDIELVEGVFIDFTDALLRNTKTKKKQIENHILQEKKEEFSKANEIYLLLKNNFHSIGRYSDESWAFEKEKEMERLSYSFPYYKEVLKKQDKIEKFPILKWIEKGYFKKWRTSAFSNMIYGYGEKPWNVIKTAVAIILIFALSFSLIGIGNPEIIELKGTGIYQNSGNIVDLVSKGLLKNNVIRNFPDSLYFSLITFTTLGYGDFRPLEGVGRILAGSEAFIGAFMMALFVYTFARRSGGR